MLQSRIVTEVDTTADMLADTSSATTHTPAQSPRSLRSQKNVRAPRGPVPLVTATTCPTMATTTATVTMAAMETTAVPMAMAIAVEATATHITQKAQRSITPRVLSPGSTIVITLGLLGLTATTILAIDTAKTSSATVRDMVTALATEATVAARKATEATVTAPEATEATVTAPKATVTALAMEATTQEAQNAA